jgi:hypothetical protein
MTRKEKLRKEIEEASYFTGIDILNYVFDLFVNKNANSIVVSKEEISVYDKDAQELIIEMLEIKGYWNEEILQELTPEEEEIYEIYKLRKKLNEYSTLNIEEKILFSVLMALSSLGIYQIIDWIF